MSKPLIIDYFLYNGEPIVEFRLDYLNSSVDYFVLIESWYTHSGIKKPELYYNINKTIFDKYKDKLIVIILEKFPDRYNDIDEIKRVFKEEIPENISDSWLRETYNRNYAQDIILERFKQPLIIFVCDVDEIPNKNFIPNISSEYNNLHNGVHIEMISLLYNFKWKQSNMWYHPFIITDIGTSKLSYSHTRLNFVNYIKNCGWHISYCFTVNDIIRKFESFAHTELDKPEYKDKKFILTCMLTGRSLLSLDKQDVLHLTETNELPENWQLFQRKLDRLLFENEYPNIK